jgi:voltage-dependent calcium channel L type alpha-1D
MGCGSQLAYPFFMVYVIVSQMILLNLFAAFVLDGFSVSTIERMSPIRSEHFESLVDKWSEYDPKASGWIDPQDIAFLVYELKAPLGKYEQYADILKTIVE